MSHGSTFDPGRRRHLLPLLIVFAKAPRPGFVKTRLGLEPTSAASLYIEFVRRTLQTASGFRHETELELSLDAPCAAWTEFSVRRSVQREGDLGVRLQAALERGFSMGYPKVVIIGSDSPTLPETHIRWLLNCTSDVALGPTLDGGYYGIGCNKVRHGMFENVRWSTENALRDTTSAIERCGMSYEIGPEWFDVDTPEDLHRYRAD